MQKHFLCGEVNSKIDFLLKTKRFSLTEKVTVTANGTYSSTQAVSLSGYTPVGIVGHNTNSANCYFVYLVCIGNTVSFMLKNTTAETLSVTNFYFDVLYVKNM